MDSKGFSEIRKRLGKTQQQLAQLLCVSPKAVQSFEQGWRKVPVRIEREMLLLLALKVSGDRDTVPCWERKNCPMEWRDNCIVWDLKIRHFCWFVNGTSCQGRVHKNWHEKMKICQDCIVFKFVIGEHVAI